MFNNTLVEIGPDACAQGAELGLVELLELRPVHQLLSKEQTHLQEMNSHIKKHHVYVCVRVRVCVHVYAHLRVCVCVRVRVCARVCACAYMRVAAW